MNTEHERSGGLVGPVLVAGFGAAVAVWCVWFVTHLPWLGLDERVSLPIVIGAWVIALGAGAFSVPRRQCLAVGTMAGVVSAVLGLLLIGTKLARPTDATGISPSAVPSAAMMYAGFLGLGAAVGLVGGACALVLGRGTNARPSSIWLARFAVLACVALAPLLFVGGLVTSTNSGMAVPDWPNTFGSNMFLYPLGPRSTPGLFLEHAHRLFGTLVGVTVLTLMVFTVLVERRNWVRWLAAIAFVLVVVQGVVGGIRVTETSRLLAMVHGVLAQITFGTVVGLAVVLSASFKAFDPAANPLGPVARRAKRFGTATLHALIVQLIFGAMYRHLRSPHVLWTHIGFSVVVMILAMIAGFILMSEPLRRSRPGAVLNRIGAGLIGVVVLQFILGWLAFLGGGSAVPAATTGEALLRTMHQANGAVLIAFATAAFVWGKRLGRAAAPA